MDKYKGQRQASGEANNKVSLGLPTYTCIFPWSVYFCDEKVD